MTSTEVRFRETCGDVRVRGGRCQKSRCRDTHAQFPSQSVRVLCGLRVVLLCWCASVLLHWQLASEQMCSCKGVSLMAIQRPLKAESCCCDPYYTLVFGAHNWLHRLQLSYFHFVRRTDFSMHSACPVYPSP
jgi:hypothetical protein